MQWRNDLGQRFAEQISELQKNLQQTLLQLTEAQGTAKKPLKKANDGASGEVPAFLNN